MSGGRVAQAVGLRERKKQRTRATLIDAAVELCNGQGFDDTTVEQIAAIADVSPRTFSRYFPTKDAIALALVDEIIDQTAVELARQPADLNHFEAIMRAYVAMAEATRNGRAGELTAERVLCITRIVLSSSTLRQVSIEFRGNSIEVALAERMGVTLDDRRVRLISATWGAVIMTALNAAMQVNADPSQLSIDDLIEQLEAVFAEFADLMGNLRQVV
ncbi:TetR family transcriptional regulator [Mycolicibacterium celeriflavum]|uniref:TetR family transcriptional regulator n=1 Tax=Mycolicibacterium celeriflavum TaxID=1249101 RepID=UPI0007FE3151|nr:TetR family transcriptional regulator [Mycolicibacterium celeriflavum]OBG19133.1 TetR family transcriptional regulator [Mycolicibacterium celeriflavum]